ncbi:uncharacterized protein CTHT_0019700 [Thermochaetoides thermophila DSM 1495]|uniref:Uncharacterized protein n=1 Tax=Chaetomium thermophilum (strain DSM 1495 / CBS 144.50 / IMI 039719) TaxID=759272 RepID=G0S354_CHATD|nr:hypothetical protein CTHT_0019700 [Thermochaetoides thermophila DSM 1495]EGS22437.1 hypothetical protein CTHT_0019700 [Thermochaetoides thermophila DSM 1495]
MIQNNPKLMFKKAPPQATVLPRVCDLRIANWAEKNAFPGSNCHPIACVTSLFLSGNMSSFTHNNALISSSALFPVNASVTICITLPYNRFISKQLVTANSLHDNLELGRW